MPCSHGSGSVGNLRESTLEEIWNGPAIQGIRSSILQNQVHPLCKCDGCPFQRKDIAFPERSNPVEVTDDLADRFDEDWYLSRHSGIRETVESGVLASGLEHFIRSGRYEGTEHRLFPEIGPPNSSHSTAKSASGIASQNNAILALREYSQGKVHLAAFPSDVIFVVTNYCNLRCVMCPQGMRRVTNPSHTPAEIAHKAIAFLKKAQRVILSGIGEPLLSPAFWAVMDALKGKKFGLLRIHSNGHFIDAENSDRILNSGLNLLLVSLDAATQETYSRIRGSDFSKPLAGLRRIIQARSGWKGSRLRISVTMTLMKENMAEAKAFVRLAKELGVDSAIFSQIFTFGDAPDWVVPREVGPFVYSDQMLEKAKEAVAMYLGEALREGELLGVKVVFHDNVESYLGRPPGAT